jgi:hypothetical protein
MSSSLRKGIFSCAGSICCLMKRNGPHEPLKLDGQGHCSIPSQFRLLPDDHRDGYMHYYTTSNRRKHDTRFDKAIKVTTDQPSVQF